MTNPSTRCGGNREQYSKYRNLDFYGNDHGPIRGCSVLLDYFYQSGWDDRHDIEC